MANGRVVSETLYDASDGGEMEEANGADSSQPNLATDGRDDSDHSFEPPLSVEDSVLSNSIPAIATANDNGSHLPLHRRMRSSAERKIDHTVCLSCL